MEWTTPDNDMEPPCPRTRFLRLLRSSIETPPYGGIHVDDAALFATDQMAMAYAMQYIVPGQSAAPDQREFAFTVELVPLDVLEVPDLTLKGIDGYNLGFDRNGIQLLLDRSPHPPLRFPFRNRFQRGDFVQIADPSNRLASWSYRDDDQVVFGVVWDSPTTKAELLGEHAAFFNPSMLSNDSGDLLVTKEILDRIYNADEDPKPTSYDNEYTIYHLSNEGWVDHTHGLPESALAPLSLPLPDEFLILHTIREYFLSDSSEAAPDMNEIFEPPANVRNVVTFNFYTRNFNQPFRSEP